MNEEELIRNINPFGLRMQPQLRARMEEAAKQNNRSLNAEITRRLEQSFEAKATSEGRATVLELKSMMTEISLFSALLSMAQQQPPSDERNTLLKQLIDRVDAMGDLQQRFSELMQALPLERPDADEKLEADKLTVKRTRRTRPS